MKRFGGFEFLSQSSLNSYGIYAESLSDKCLEKDLWSQSQQFENVWLLSMLSHKNSQYIKYDCERISSQILKINTFWKNVFISFSISWICFNIESVSWA